MNKTLEKIVNKKQTEYIRTFPYIPDLRNSNILQVKVYLPNPRNPYIPDERNYFLK